MYQLNPNLLKRMAMLLTWLANCDPLIDLGGVTQLELTLHSVNVGSAHHFVSIRSGISYTYACMSAWMHSYVMKPDTVHVWCAVRGNGQPKAFCFQVVQRRPSMRMRPENMPGCLMHHSSIGAIRCGTLCSNFQMINNYILTKNISK